jgi:hypothetical protein
MPTSGASINISPTGTQTINISTDYGTEIVANSALDSLANGANISGLSYSNISGATNAKVVIIIQKISPTGSPNIQIDDGTSYYEISIDTSTSAKRVEFNDIPASFLANFKIFNNLGVALPASGNTCTIYPV